jgi:hypothetical protein
MQNGDIMIYDLSSRRHNVPALKITKMIQLYLSTTLGNTDALETTGCTDVIINWKGQRAAVPDSSLTPTGTPQATLVVEHALSESLEHILMKIAGYFVGATPTSVQEVIVLKSWVLPAGIAMLAIHYTRNNFLSYPSSNSALRSPTQLIEYGTTVTF